MGKEITVTPTEVERIIDGEYVETESRTLYKSGIAPPELGANSTEDRWRGLLGGTVDELRWRQFGLRVTLEDEGDESHVEEWSEFLHDSIEDQPGVLRAQLSARGECDLAVKLVHDGVDLSLPEAWEEVERETALGITFAWLKKQTADTIETVEGAIEYIKGHNECCSVSQSMLRLHDIAIKYRFWGGYDDDPTLPDGWSVDDVGGHHTWVSQDE
jgi:hypothetical protein